MYNGPMGGAEGFNGVTQGGQGALKGGDVNSTSMSAPSGGVTNVVDPGTLMAIKAMLPALQGQKKAGMGAGGIASGAPETGTTSGSQQKQLGQPQQNSQPRSPGGPGVTAIGGVPTSSIQHLLPLFQGILGLINK